MVTAVRACGKPVDLNLNANLIIVFARFNITLIWNGLRPQPNPPPPPPQPPVWGRHSLSKFVNLTENVAAASIFGLGLRI